MIAPVVVANWKMHKSPSETEALLSEVIPGLREMKAGAEVEVIVAPPFTSLPIAARILAGTGVALCAQDCHWSEEGPYTGEVSARMLAEVGCRFVILGHSERRELFAETNRRVNMKASAALFWGLTPIICVGEKEDDRVSGHAEMVVERQLKRCLSDLKLDKGQRIMVAYEPVWAIGSGRTPTPPEVDEIHRLIRAELLATFEEECAAILPILYGGSVTPANAKPMLALDAVDGVLVGGASLEPAKFLQLAGLIREAGPQGGEA
ncbi:MAG TPA: triose-phosphate isomerase [Candidatus Polarisedimenticolia bacterium]|jgi:triosephosphate isomerase